MSDEPLKIDPSSAKAVRDMADAVKNLENHTEATLAEAVYKAAQDNGIEPKDFFSVIYRILIGKEKGPRLAGFIITAGKEKILPLLEKY